LGQVNFYPMSIRDPAEICTAIAGSNVVINLMGIHVETSRWSFKDIHTTFPSVLAEACAEAGVQKLVHVSALGASVDSPSQWCVSKAVGEQMVHEAFPSATIIRPATMFGDTDRFLNRIARIAQMMPFFPVVDGDETRVQPVYVDDVAGAVIEALVKPELAGATLELAGPKVYTNSEVVNYTLKVINEPQSYYNVPRSVGNMMAFGVQQLPDAWLTCDMLRRESVDIVREGGGTGFEGLGITPEEMEEIGERYLIRFRKTSMFIDEDAEKVVSQPKV